MVPIHSVLGLSFRLGGQGFNVQLPEGDLPLPAMTR